MKSSKFISWLIIILFQSVPILAQMDSVNFQLQHIRRLPPPQAKLEVDKVLNSDTLVYQYLISEQMAFPIAMIVVLSNDDTRITRVYNWLERDFINKTIDYRRQVELTNFLQRYRCKESLGAECLELCEKMIELNPDFPGCGYFHASANYSYISSLIYNGRLDSMDFHINRMLHLYDRYSDMDPRSKIHMNYAMAEAYQIKGDLDQAEGRLLLVKEVFDQANVPRSYEWAKLNNNLGVIYNLMGRNSDAIHHFEEALLTIRKGPPIHSKLEAGLLHNLGFINSRIGNYRLALAFLKEAIKLNLDGDVNFVEPSRLLSNLATVYLDLAEYDLALDHINQALQLAQASPVMNDRQLFKSKFFKVGILIQMNLMDSVKAELAELSTVFESNLMSYQDSISYYLLLGQVHSKFNDYDLSINAYHTALNLTRYHKLGQHELYRKVLFDLGQTYFKNRDEINAQNYYKVGLDALNGFIDAEFIRFSSEDMRSNVQRFYSLLNECYESTMQLNDEDLASQTLDLSIKTKGIVLQSQVRLRGHVQSTSWMDYLEEPNNLAHENLIDQKLRYKSIVRENSKSDLLPKSILKYKDLSALKIDMSDNDILLDWIEADNPNEQDSVLLAVHLYDKMMESPIKIFIGTVHKDDLLIERDSMNRSDRIAILGDLLFQNIIPLINSNHIVHVCASPVLNKIPLAALLEHVLNGQNLVHQYISWQNFTDSRIQFVLENIDSALLVGGLVYEENTNSSHQTSESNINVSNLRSLMKRYADYTWPNLAYTNREVNLISDILKDQRVKTYVMSEDKATEVNLRDLLKINSPGIVHMATHGFLLDLEEASTDLDQSVEDLLESSAVLDPLKRMGLLLSNGAASWWSEQAIPSDLDNLLTAREIQQLDWSGTSLIVLSACQTGKSALSSQHPTIGEDGIYGLASALKLAGAKQLILSLWDVDDRASMEFMVLFYEELMETKSAALAMKNTRALMKQKYPDPKDWAGWVLIN